MTMTSFVWRPSLVLRMQSELVQYFAQQFSFAIPQVIEQHCELNEKVNKFNKQTCLNVKH